MKIKTGSWVLGGAYFLCAVMFFLVTSRFAVAFAEQGIVLPAPTKAAFALGPFGWLLLMVVIGSIAVLKDLACPSRVLDFAFSIVLIVMVLFVAFAMVIPTIPVHAQNVPHKGDEVVGIAEDEVKSCYHAGRPAAMLRAQ